MIDAALRARLADVVREGDVRALLGELVDVAGECGRSSEVEEDLQEWADEDVEGVKKVDEDAEDRVIRKETAKTLEALKRQIEAVFLDGSERTVKVQTTRAIVKMIDAEIEYQKKGLDE